MEFWTLVGTMALALAPGLMAVVAFLKRVDESGRVPKAAWLLIACALGVAAVFVMNLDVSAVPGGQGREAVIRVLVGLGAGGLASGYHEASAALRSIEKKNLANVSAEEL
jgi:hypothetical protein